MQIIGWLIFGVIVYWLIQTIRKNRTPLSEKADTVSTGVEKNRIASVVANQKKLLEEKPASSISQIKESSNLNSVFWQFVPKIDLNTSKQVLDNAYHLYSEDEYEQLAFTDNGEEWIKLESMDQKRESPVYLGALARFRHIVESGDSREKIIEQINQLVDSSSDLAKKFFDNRKENLSPGDHWFADIMHNDGLPFAHVLYGEGYTTPEKCLEIEPAEFIKRKGVGPKKVEQLKQFQSKVRDELVSS